MLGLRGYVSQHVWECSGVTRSAQIGRPGDSAELFSVGASILFVERPVNEAGMEAGAADNDLESAIRPMPDHGAASDRLRECRLERRL